MKHRITITVMVFTMLFGVFGCGGESKNKVTSVESLTLTLHGMRGSSVYKLEPEAASAELRRYREIYSGEKTILELEQSAICDLQEITDLLNTCGIFRWDGFHGKHPKNVSDGIMFNFTAEVNGGHTINADGSANFPKGYYEFVRALDAILAESENE